MERKMFNEMVCLDRDEQDVIHTALQGLAREESQCTFEDCSHTDLYDRLVQARDAKLATIQKILEKLDATEYGRGIREQAAETAAGHWWSEPPEPARDHEAALKAKETTP